MRDEKGDSTMQVAFVASECDPFVKTGGLADVVGSLPLELAESGNRVCVILPYYRSIKQCGFEMEVFFKSMGVWMGTKEEWCAVKKLKNSGSVEFYFIEFDEYFDREGIYCDSENNDYKDNSKRFAFFSRAALQFLKDVSFDPDVVHVHDWQTAPVCAYLKIWDWGNSNLKNAKSVLTIHNIGYQGVYPADTYNYSGLGWENFVPSIFEAHGAINFLKGGIHFADVVTTVSPTYAKETLYGKESCGMGPYLNGKGANYIGILNGVDYGRWDPSVDKLIPFNYDHKDLKGKKKCKKVLQEKFGLNIKGNIPIIGVVSRFATQKGLDVLAQTIEAVLNSMVVQIVVLGSGDRDLEEYYSGLAQRMEGKAGCYIGYSNELAHLIEAGSDFFIMPSRYEPCGLNQIYSLRYGTLPIVRNTGGLADTVEQYNEQTGEGTGFKFDYLTPNSVYDTIGWAVSTYFDRPAHFKAMVKRAMKKDFSWKNSSKEYEKIYSER
jgi:starch synthase